MCSMLTLVTKLIPAVRLTRLTMAFGAVSDVWFVILLTRADPVYDTVPVARMNTLAAILAGALVAVGLFAYAAALNDILDVRHDTAFSPERPIPAGRIRFGQAVVVTVGALILAILGALSLGTGALLATLLVAAGILFFNAAGKYIPAVGFVTIGLVHAAHMLIPNVSLVFMWPVWLIFTHSMVIAIVVHHLEDKRPRTRRRTWVGVGLGWIFWSGAIIGTGIWRGEAWPSDVPWWSGCWPMLAVIAFGFVAWWKTSTVPGIIAAEKLKRYGAMWQALYGATWLVALGLHVEAAAIAVFALFGFVSMTVIKEVAGLSGRPIVYR